MQLLLQHFDASRQLGHMLFFVLLLFLNSPAQVLHFASNTTLELGNVLDLREFSNAVRRVGQLCIEVPGVAGELDNGLAKNLNGFDVATFPFVTIDLCALEVILTELKHSLSDRTQGLTGMNLLPALVHLFAKF